MHERTLQFNGGLILFLTVLMIDEALSTALTWFMKRKDNSLRHA